MDITHGLTLSKAVKDKNTPLRKFLAERFPDTRAIRREYKGRTGELLVDSLGAPSTTTGTAMDLAIRFMLDPTDVPQSARILFHSIKGYTDTVDELAAAAGAAVGTGEASSETFARAVWGLALCVTAHRVGLAAPSVVFDLLGERNFNASTMMAQASPIAVQELTALGNLASRRLVPALERPFHLGPEFDASRRNGPGDGRLIAAEADLICNGLLLDIKTKLGTKNPKSGIRSDALAIDDLYQLLAYALLDHSDTYGISSLGIYSARYGALVTWPLEHLTSTMAGGPVDFPEAREQIRAMLLA